MASRLGLSRIIDWGRACDREELAYVLVRLTTIARERNDREREVLLPGKPKRRARSRKATLSNVTTVHTDEAEHLDAPERPERGMSA